jgi:flagellar hook protein FlgE
MGFAKLFFDCGRGRVDRLAAGIEFGENAMGIFDALTTSVGGLQAQSFALQNISGNIANASTTAFKGINTNFEDLISDATTPSEQAAGGVVASAQQTITTSGTISASTVATNLAINGDGFFSVEKPTGTTDNLPVFDGVTDYTRRGDFQLDTNGNLVNGAGYFLEGVPVDPKTGNPLGSVPQVLQFQNNFVPAQATSAIQYAANLPTTPTTTAGPAATAGTITAAGGLNPADFSQTSNPLPIGSTTGFGAAVSSQAGTSITGATLLSGAAGTDSLTSGFVAGDTVTVNGTTITFVSTGSAAGTTALPLASPTPASINVDISDSVGSLLARIDAITGNATPSSVSGGALVLNTGTVNDLKISAPAADATAVAALGALGIPAGVDQTRGTGIVTANDLPAFNNESISGGAVTAFNTAGTPINLQLRWAKTDSSTLGSPPHQDAWNLFYQASPNASGANAAWVNVGTTFTFNPNGSLASPTGSSITIPNVKVSGQNLGTISFNIGSGALTQFATTAGTATVDTFTQNGFSAGQLASVAINDNGLVVGTFSNGQNINLASVSLSHFNGPNFLQALDGGAYAVTNQSGPAILGASGSIKGSSLEGSNTDIADQFTQLIVTQQAYSANTKVITTANQMIQTLLQVIQ